MLKIYLLTQFYVFYRSAVVPETKPNPAKVENGRTMENPSSGENVAMNQLNQVGK